MAVGIFAGKHSSIVSSPFFGITRKLTLQPEGPFSAGVLFYLSKWYTKEEFAFRTSLFFCATLISGAFGALIAAGVLSGLNGVRGYSAWQ